MKRIIIITLSVVLILGIVCFIPKRQEFSAYIPDALGTVSEIKIYAKDSSALEECTSYIHKMDSLLSNTNPESEISKLNKKKYAYISSETKDVLEISLSFADSSTFNPFCGTLIDLWDNAKKNNTLPQPQDIILSDCFPPALKLDGNNAYIENPNQEINLGAVAKGYITDNLIKILNSYNVDSALISLGGNVYAKGKNKNGELWKIGIADPDNTGEYIGIISASDTAVITSGDYERYFEINGKRYHHILDPETGYPAESGLRSVTIITQNATLGDILSTKCFIAGFENSKNILKQYNAYAVFITDDHKIFYSNELESIFYHEENEYDYQAF